MKIGMRSGSFYRWGEQRYEKMRESGYDSAMLSMLVTEGGFYEGTAEEMAQALRREKALADAAEVRITQIHGPFRMPPRDLLPEDLAERREKMLRSLYAASILECPCWIVHPLMPMGNEDEAHADLTRRVNEDFLGELTHASRDLGVTICLENMPYTTLSLASPRAVGEFVRKMNLPGLKMCLDTGHANLFCRGTSDTPATFLTEFADVICSLHIHDNNGRMDSHQMPYWGNIDWEAFAKALTASGYPGDFTLEANLPGRLDDELFSRVLAFQRRIAGDIVSLM